MAGFFLIILLFIIMIWGELEYTLGGLIVAIAFVVLVLMGLFKLADSGNEDDKQKSSEASTANNNKEDGQQNPENLETMSFEETVRISAPESSAAGVHGGRASYSDNCDDDNDDDDDSDDDWDNSREAGGMPRDLSPFSDIDDPYDRAELEWDMFDERDGGDFWD